MINLQDKTFMNVNKRDWCFGLVGDLLFTGQSFSRSGPVFRA